MRKFRFAILVFLAFGIATAARADMSQPRNQLRGGDIALVYATQWLVYGVTQHEIIQEHGKLSNMIDFPFKPVYDKDGYDFNIIKHSISGHYYYLFYRSRGYTEINAFWGSFVSSLAFEFAVETLTEKPSVQDIYQTPVFGTVLGVGAENVSNLLRASSSPFLRGMGYILNPFSLVSWGQDTVRIIPNLSPGTPSITLIAEF